MWKYVTRRIRDTFERSANHFDRRSTTGVVNSTPSNFYDEKSKCASPCKWFSSRKCWNSFQNDNDTNSKKWNFEHLNKSWIGAITWSSALVLGWYTSQLIHLKLKYQLRDSEKISNKVNTLFSALHPYKACVIKNEFCLNSFTEIGRIVSDIKPTVHSVSNDNIEAQGKSVSHSTTPDTSDDALGDVLNSIENRLGLAAIESGQYQDGLNLLRSAATRNHAPALYNLGLCYEMGLGVTVNENTAMELYKSAAALDHPGALYNLGIYYGQGRGGLKIDQETATRLLRLAAVQGQQEAIDALEALNVTITEPPRNNLDIWSYQRTPFFQNESIVPTQTRLFVENVNYLHNQQDATVY